MAKIECRARHWWSEVRNNRKRNACKAVHEGEEFNIEVGFACKGFELLGWVAKKTEQISVRLFGETMAVLRQINEKHGLIPTELTCRLIEGAVEFFRKNGWFSLPVDIYPQAFSQSAESMAGEEPPKESSKKKR